MSNDSDILKLISAGRLHVDTEQGLVFAPKSNTPSKAVGALTKKGYLRVCVNLAGKQMHFMVHRIIWVSVHGPLKDGFEIDHRDADKRNNRLSNLEAVPGRVNIARARESGFYRGNGRKDGLRDAKGRFGSKARAGRLLDGVQHDGFPS